MKALSFALIAVCSFHASADVLGGQCFARRGQIAGTIKTAPTFGRPETWCMNRCEVSVEQAHRRADAITVALLRYTGNTCAR